MRLENKVAIITGAASGMGKATAELFALERAKVIAPDINIDFLNQVVEGINNKGFSAIAIQLDVANGNNWQEVITQTLNTYGRIDILVNNAGI